MKSGKLNRIMITLSDENLLKLEKVYERVGITKSAQIQSLIVKFLDSEFGNNEKERK